MCPKHIGTIVLDDGTYTITESTIDEDSFSITVKHQSGGERSVLDNASAGSAMDTILRIVNSNEFRRRYNEEQKRLVLRRIDDSEEHW